LPFEPRSLKTPGGASTPLTSLASVVVSAPGTQWRDPAGLQAAVIRQVCTELSLPEPDAVRTVTERRATPTCTPDRPRIDADALKAMAPGLWLAGDWVWHQYPGTLEGAVRSGEAAAQHAIEAHAQALSQA
jgi:predicted NAD/FAD-dependent oxidoreductase